MTKNICGECGKELIIVGKTTIRNPLTNEFYPLFKHKKHKEGIECQQRRTIQERNNQATKFWKKILAPIK